MGCMMITNKSMEKLPLAQQQVIRASAAKLSQRLEAVGVEQDEKLMGGLFGRQGLTVSPISDGFRSEFWQAAKAASAQLGEKLAPAAMVKRVSDLVAAYRAGHPTTAGR
jgi:hypothetical protein